MDRRALAAAVLMHDRRLSAGGSVAAELVKFIGAIDGVAPVRSGVSYGGINNMDRFASLIVPALRNAAAQELLFDALSAPDARVAANARAILLHLRGLRTADASILADAIERGRFANISGACGLLSLGAQL